MDGSSWLPSVERSSSFKYLQLAGDRSAAFLLADRFALGTCDGAKLRWAALVRVPGARLRDAFNQPPENPKGAVVRRTSSGKIGRPMGGADLAVHSARWQRRQVMPMGVGASGLGAARSCV